MFVKVVYGCMSPHSARVRALHTMTRQDQLVRATDLDALSCRASANKKGYFVPEDPYIPALVTAYEQCLQHCDGYTQYSASKALRNAFQTKYPLINRGTFYRTRSIDRIVADFIAEYGKCQIVALGGGSDTRAFRVLPAHPHVTYTEIDFPEQTKVKRVAISNSRILQQAVGVEMGAEGASAADFQNMPSDLHSDRYHLVGMDLRALEHLPFLDPQTPSLLLSECVLCYLTPAENVRVFEFWRSHLNHVGIAMYDPMALDDAFGRTMAGNLAQRGLDLGSFVQYPDLHSRGAFFSGLGFKVNLTDLASVGGYGSPGLAWIPAAEWARVSRLEMIDEVEEISMLLRHYCLIYAERGLTSAFPGGHKWVIPREPA